MAEALTLHPLRSWLHSTLMRGAPRETPGGVVLPDQSATSTATDALILAIGPEAGWLSPGDRVLAQKHDALLVDWERLDVLIDARNVVAFNRGPAWAQWLPAHDWVMLAPEAPRAVDQESGCVVERSEGKILVASHSLAGREGRVRMRGEELHADLLRLRASPRFAEASTQGPFFQASSGEVLSYEQDRLLNDFTGRLSTDEQAALVEAIERDGTTGWQDYRPLLWRDGADRGAVVAKGPACRDAQVTPGARVLWDHETASVVIHGAGLTCIREKDLSGVLE